MPAWVVPTAAAAATLGGSLYSNWQRKQEYEKRKQDNIDFWKMQNTYNHPSAQRKRLEEAGLNIGLMYGQGAAGASGQAGNISTVDMPQPQFQEPFMNTASSFINTYYDTSIKKAQSNNLDSQTNVNNTTELLKNLELAFKDKTFDSRVKGQIGRDWDTRLGGTMSAGAYTQLSKMNRKEASEIYSIYFDAKKEELRKLQINNRIDNVMKYNLLQEQITNLRKQNKYFEANLLTGAANKLLIPFIK